MKKIREKAKTEELDYLFLMNCLSTYKKPRDKLTALIKKNQLIRVKKGLYVFGKDYRERPYSLEILSNLIHGPSYISFEYALSYHGLIPEMVTRITGASLKRIKYFKTAVGEFAYYYVPKKVFPLGITWQSLDENAHFLIAKKEKALADYVAKIKPFANSKDLYEYLVDGMRIDFDDLSRLQISLMNEISLAYQTKNVTFLCEALKK